MLVAVAWVVGYSGAVFLNVLAKSNLLNQESTAFVETWVFDTGGGCEANQTEVRINRDEEGVSPPDR